MITPVFCIVIIQEQILSSDFWFWPFTNWIGGLVHPWYNRLINYFMSYKHNNEDFQMAKNVYPGENWCNYRIPHAKWHLQTSIAVLDLVRITQDLDQIFRESMTRLHSAERFEKYNM